MKEMRLLLLLGVAVLLHSLFLVAASTDLPFIVFHGISDECKHRGLTRFTNELANMSGSPGYCIEIGNGARDSWFMRLDKQVEFACDKIKSMPELQGGYNIVGLSQASLLVVELLKRVSQGNLIGRGVIEWCDGPPVHNMVSLGGPHAGIASVPLCSTYSFCKLADMFLQLGVYSKYVQDHLAPTGYIKMPKELDLYYKSCAFLPKLNNELPQNRNATFNRRLSKINQLVLIKFDKDTVLVPQQTAWFGFFPPNNLTHVLPMEETALYEEDWIGLKSLHEQGKIKFFSFAGNHLEASEEEMKEHIVPYLIKTESSQYIEHPEPYSTLTSAL